MFNLKLNDNQVKKLADNFDKVPNELSSDDDRITKRENLVGSSNFDFLGVIDSVTQRKNGKEDESDEEKISNDVKMESHGNEDDLDIQIDVNPKNSRSFELNIVDNNSVGTSSRTNVQNIGFGTSNNTNNFLDGNDLDEYLRNKEKDKANNIVFNLYDTPTDYLF